MTFEELGRSIDELFDGFSELAQKIAERFEHITNPTYRLEARRLAEDAAERGYDIVQRNNVEVTRNDTTNSLECYYCDGSEWNHVKTYDPSELRSETA